MQRHHSRDKGPSRSRGKHGSAVTIAFFRRLKRKERVHVAMIPPHVSRTPTAKPQSVNVLRMHQPQCYNLENDIHISMIFSNRPALFVVKTHNNFIFLI